jgi:hypothetical protein
VLQPNRTFPPMAPEPCHGQWYSPSICAWIAAPLLMRSFFRWPVSAGDAISPAPPSQLARLLAAVASRRLRPRYVHCTLVLPRTRGGPGAADGDAALDPPAATASASIFPAASSDTGSDTEPEPDTEPEEDAAWQGGPRGADHPHQLVTLWRTVLRRASVQGDLADATRMLLEVSWASGGEGRSAGPPMILSIRASAFEVLRLLWHGPMRRAVCESACRVVERFGEAGGGAGPADDPPSLLPPTGITAAGCATFQPENLIRNAAAMCNFLTAARGGGDSDRAPRRAAMTRAFAAEFLPMAALQANSLVVPIAAAAMLTIDEGGEAGTGGTGFPTGWLEAAVECVRRSAVDAAGGMGSPSWLAQAVALMRAGQPLPVVCDSAAQDMDARTADLGTLSLMARFMHARAGAEGGRCSSAATTWRAIERALLKFMPVEPPTRSFFALDTEALVSGLVVLQHMPRLTCPARRLWITVVRELCRRWECVGGCEASPLVVVAARRKAPGSQHRPTQQHHVPTMLRLATATVPAER